MKKTLKGYLLGFLSAVIIVGSISVFATANSTTLYDVIVDGIKIVLDGKEFTCTDANGTVVQPMIYNGTTYIPVRAVSSAFGKAVYWDGDNQTVYLGKMDGKLEKPSALLDDFDNLGYNYGFEKLDNTFDNYGNYYNIAYRSTNGFWKDDFYECLLDKKYSVFKATLFMEKGSKAEGSEIKIIGDEKVLFTSDTLNKTSKPIDIQVDIKGINDFRIIFDDTHETHIANAGFYQ